MKKNVTTIMIIETKITKNIQKVIVNIYPADTPTKTCSAAL